jgi:hypothetical protein
MAEAKIADLGFASMLATFKPKFENETKSETDVEEVSTALKNNLKNKYSYYVGQL